MCVKSRSLEEHGLKVAMGEEEREDAMDNGQRGSLFFVAFQFM